MTAQIFEFPTAPRAPTVLPAGHASYDPDTGVPYFVADGELWVVARDRALREEIKSLRGQLRAAQNNPPPA